MAEPGFSKCVCHPEGPPKKVRRWYAPWRTFLVRKLILDEDLVLTREDGSTYTIYKDAESDGASIPMLFSWFMPSRIDTLEGGFYHDDTCRKGFDLQWCDSELRTVLVLYLNIHPFYAYLMYLALRIASPWRDKNTYSWITFFKNVLPFVWR